MDMQLTEVLHPDGLSAIATTSLAGAARPQPGSAAKLTFAILLGSSLLFTSLAHSTESSPTEPALSSELDLPSSEEQRQTSRLLHRSRQLEDYRNAIAQMEAEQGAWGTGLAEQLAGLGETYQVRGQHRDAIEIFNRAIHVSRINNGLYDLGQVPIIDRLLESLKARGLWEEVHNRHQYLYWLHKRNFGADDPRMLPVIDRLGKWYINDYALNPNRRMMGQLVDAHNLFQQAIYIIDGTYGQEDLRLIEPLRGIVMSNWFFYNYTGNTGVSPMERDQFSRDIAVDQVHFAEDQNNRFTQYMRNNYADGKQAIERMVEIYSKSADAPPGAAAQAKIELADWEQLFDRRRNAQALYEEAYKELLENEETRHLADKAFAQPVALPALDLVEAEIAVDDEDTPVVEHYVLVSFDVNRFGRPERVEVIESFPEDANDHRTRIRRTLESTQFRPRMVNGVAVETKGMTQKYVFAGN